MASWSAPARDCTSTSIAGSSPGRRRAWPETTPTAKELAIKAIVITGLSLIILVGAGCSTGPNLDREVGAVVRPYRFNVLAWEMKTLFQPVNSDGGDSWLAEDGAGRVVEHFARERQLTALKSQSGNDAADNAAVPPERLRAGRETTIQRVLEGQITETLSELGIYHPWYNYIKLKVNLPPLYFKLERPPYILVVSPRDRIQTVKTVLLNSDITPQDIGRIEAEVDRLNVSSLVDGLGGLGSTYPALVASDTSLEFVIDTAVHEWVHQYLFFTPLGFTYALDRIGVARDPDIVTMNETVANMIGKEVSEIVRRKYYPTYRRGSPAAARPAVDFGKEMRQIRQTVDRYLAQGEIERAEAFMEERRQYLAANGYYIRKLNQAYFAFHGGYADVPAFMNPIGEDLKKLRSDNASVRDFLDAVAGMSSRRDLRLAAGGPGQN